MARPAWPVTPSLEAVQHGHLVRDGLLFLVGAEPACRGLLCCPLCFLGSVHKVIGSPGRPAGWLATGASARRGRLGDEPVVSPSADISEVRPC